MYVTSTPNLSYGKSHKTRTEIKVALDNNFVAYCIQDAQRWDNIITHLKNKYGAFDIVMADFFPLEFFGLIGSDKTFIRPYQKYLSFGKVGRVIYDKGNIDEEEKKKMFEIMYYFYWDAYNHYINELQRNRVDIINKVNRLYESKIQQIKFSCSDLRQLIQCAHKYICEKNFEYIAEILAWDNLCSIIPQNVQYDPNYIHPTTQALWAYWLDEFSEFSLGKILQNHDEKPRYDNGKKGKSSPDKVKPITYKGPTWDTLDAELIDLALRGYIIITADPRETVVKRLARILDYVSKLNNILQTSKDDTRAVPLKGGSFHIYANSSHVQIVNVRDILMQRLRDTLSEKMP